MGGLSTTMIVGARSIARGKSGVQGLLTETEEFAGLDLQGLDGLVFGGHEVRKGKLQESAEEIYRHTGTIPYELIKSLATDLRKVDKNIRPGCLINAGKTITKLSGTKVAKGSTLRKESNRVVKDIKEFMTRNKLKRCVCVNLTRFRTHPGCQSSHCNPAICHLRLRRRPTRAALYSLHAIERRSNTGHPKNI
jgi:myo-inositol-1-phosphate synthase